jgi:2-polyprenyl-3-methyl-5-hydroxy-6-metoxy-1,4-benzoquinol methylase
MKLPCPVCNTPSSFESECADAKLYRCAVCDHCFSDADTMPAFEEYTAEYYESHKNWFDNPNLGLFDIVSRAAAAGNPGRSLLDVGCGRGDLLRHLADKNKDLVLTGIDLSPNESDDRVTFIREDIMSFELPQRYDIVTSLLVVEHLVDVQAFVRRLRELCTSDGTIIITTINDRSVLYGTARLLKRLGYRVAFDQLYGKHHLNHFSKSSFRKLLLSSGLTLRSMVMHDIPLAAVNPPESAASALAAVLKAGVATTFLLGKLTGRTYLQTAICGNRTVTQP